MTFSDRNGLAASLLALAANAWSAGDTSSGSVEIQLQDARGTPAVSVALMASPDAATHPTLAAPPATAVMDQVDERFVPEMLVVRAGTAVSFPNSDQVRHHVYSFSEAKRFELALYRGNVHDPVIFDRPGLVVLGCNIHDHMVGYILVADTPYFGISDADGTLRLQGLPDGTYHLTAWHPGMDVPEMIPSTLSIPSTSSTTFRVRSGWESRGQMALSWDDY